MQEMQVQSLGREDPLEKEMATYSSVLAWKTLMDRGVWQAIVHGVAKSRTWLSLHAMQLDSQASTSTSRCIIMGGKETSIQLHFCYRQSEFPHLLGMSHHCPAKFLLCRIVQWALQDGGPVFWPLALRLLSHMKSSLKKRICLLLISTHCMNKLF